MLVELPTRLTSELRQDLVDEQLQALPAELGRDASHERVQRHRAVRAAEFDRLLRRHDRPHP